MPASSNTGTGSRQRGGAAWLGFLAVLMLFFALGCGLTELYQQTPTPTVSGEVAPVTENPPESPTETALPDTPPVPTDTPQATATTSSPTMSPPTATEASQATATLTPPPPTASSTPLPPPPTATPEAQLAITAFTVEVTDLTSGGKRVTCTWATTGATEARIMAGTSRRFIPWWTVAPNGSHTFELTNSVYPDPEIQLTAYDAAGESVQAAQTLSWPCRYEYFFVGTYPTPEICPHAPATATAAAQQPFQNGSMFWLQEVDGVAVIYVLYRDGNWARYQDTWTEDQVESDPNIQPPENLLQPIRGFGKVWRNHPEVQTKLGWAVAGEAGYTATHQRASAESVGQERLYVTTIDNVVVELAGPGAGTWRYLTP